MELEETLLQSERHRRHHGPAIAVVRTKGMLLEISFCFSRMADTSVAITLSKEPISAVFILEDPNTPPDQREFSFLLCTTSKTRRR
jgi:hypothetical protein